MTLKEKISYRKKIFRYYALIGIREASRGLERGFKLTHIPSWAFKAQRDGYYYGRRRIEK